MAGDLPLDPVGRPSLVADQSTERAGQFIVDLSGATPQPQGREQVNQTYATMIPPVAFLFRFEEIATHNVSYIWTVSAIDSQQN